MQALKKFSDTTVCGGKKRILTYLYCTKYNEISKSFSYTNACFVYRITQKLFDILYGVMLGNGRKYIFNYVSLFVSIISNFNALSDAYSVCRH